MIEVLLMVTTGFLCISCFVIGTKVGQTVSKGEKVDMPNLNPFKAIRESQARKEAEQEVKQKQDKLDKVLRNIDRYDGTSKGQEDVG